MGAPAWYSVVSLLIEAKRLRPIEAARIYALVSMAVSDVYSADSDARLAYDKGPLCTSCTVNAAILVILESEFRSARTVKTAMTSAGTSGAVRELTRVRGHADESSFGRPNDRFDYGLSIKAGEEMGKKIGMQALTYYRS